MTEFNERDIVFICKGNFDSRFGTPLSALKAYYKDKTGTPGEIITNIDILDRCLIPTISKYFTKENLINMIQYQIYEDLFKEDTEKIYLCSEYICNLFIKEIFLHISMELDWTVMERSNE